MATGTRYPLSAASGPRFAADIVAVVREGGRVRLDYSPGSLATLDHVIEGIRRERPPRQAVSDILIGFGCYLGEVMVREAGAEWVDFDTTQRLLYAHPFGVRTSDGCVWNPLGQALARYDNGPATSLRRFYLSVVEPVLAAPARV
jgi:hypothetical protein